MYADTNACVLRARLLERAMTLECALRARRLAPDSCRCAVREAAAAGILRNVSAVRVLLPRAVVKLRCCDVRVQLAVRLCERRVHCSGRARRSPHLLKAEGSLGRRRRAKAILKILNLHRVSNCA